MDAFIASDTEQAWIEQQEGETVRAHETLCRLMGSQISLENFKKVWYSQFSDKQGKDYIYNLCMSISQARKVRAGNGFENTIKKIHDKNGINALYQTWVDNEGNIHEKKPSVSVHKHDSLIRHKEATNIQDMIVLSIKTTLRERFREDLDSVSKCKKVIFLTREQPTQGHLDVLKGYNCVVVFPNAPLTEHTWSYDDYALRMKYFQETGSYSLT